MCVCVCVCVYVCVCVCVCVCVLKYDADSHTHTYTQTSIYIYIYSHLHYSIYLCIQCNIVVYRCMQYATDITAITTISGIIAGITVHHAQPYTRTHTRVQTDTLNNVRR